MTLASTPRRSALPCRPCGPARRGGPGLTPRAAEQTDAATTATAAAAGSEGEWADPRAGPRTKRPENVAGAFWVDSKCIDCDTCRRIAPAAFARVNGQSAVVAQPPGAATDVAALTALLSCPTFSIHADPKPDKAALAAAAASLPGPVPGVLPREAGGPPVLYCGMTAGSSFGASSYLLLRGGEGRGNILIDSPRFDKGLLARILAHGPVDFMFLTHRDDVADHAAWAAALGCPRLIHAKETNAGQRTDECEVQLDGAGPWRLPDGDPGVELFLQPGHTEASVMLHHAPSRSLFSGDVICFAGGGSGPAGDGPWSAEPPARPGGGPGLMVHRAYTWYSIPALLDSLEAGVVGRDWLHLLPGHGRMGSFRSGDDREAALAEVIARERAHDAAGAPARASWV